jgi:methionyl-tRNA synthetase
MPHAAARVLDLLNIGKTPPWNDAFSGEILPPGHECRAPEPLFPRIPVKSLEEYAQKRRKETQMSESSEASTQTGPNTSAEEVRSVPTDAGAVPPVAAATNAAASTTAQPEQASPDENTTIEYADFARVELRAARILEAERVPKADKLLKLQVDLVARSGRFLLESHSNSSRSRSSARQLSWWLTSHHVKCAASNRRECCWPLPLWRMDLCGSAYSRCRCAARSIIR